MRSTSLLLWLLGCLAAGAAAGGELTLPENRWTRVAEVPADPLGRELDPGRGAYWCFDPVNARFLRYGGYTPTDCNAAWTFDLAARKWENPLAVDYAWPPPADRPGAGAWWSTAWDAKRKVIWFCGGSGVAARKQPALYGDIWQYDPARKTFAAMKSKGFPAFSAGCRIAYDAKQDLVIRAPAYDGEWAAMCNRDTTWVYDPGKNAWEGRKTPGSPKNALCAVLVFDPAAGKTVYLSAEKDHLAGTWTFDAAAGAWARLETKERPPARVVAGAAYDPGNKLIVICGGVGGKAGGYGYLHRGGGVQLADTWTLDVGKAEWRKLDVGAPELAKLPGERGPRFEHFCAMDYDVKNGALVLSAPTVGVWALRYRPEGSAALPELKLAAPAPLPKPEPPKEPVFKLPPPNKKLVDLEENKWTQLEGGPSIGGGEVPMTYDEATGYCLKFGGCNNGGAGTFSSGYGNDLSAYDPATERWIALRWVDPSGPPRPANGCTRFYAYDPVRKVTWFAGGTAGNHLAASLPPGGAAGGTWCYDGLKDRFDLVPTTGKQPRPGTVCCYDRANNLFVADPKEAWAQPNVFHFDPVKKAWALGAGIKGYPYTFGCYVDSLKCLMAVKADGKEAPRTMLYDAAAAAWRDAAPGGDPPHAAGRATLACDPDNDVVLCVLNAKSYVYDVKGNTWKTVETNTPKVCEEMVFDRRHKVFLASAAMGCHMWAYRWRKAK